MQKLALFCLGLSFSCHAAIDVTSYRLKGKVNWESQKLEASVLIDLESTNETLILNSEVSKVLQVTDADGHPLAYTYTSPELKVALPRPGRFQIRVGYETDKSALHVVPHRKGDPIPGRVTFTLSEPQGARQWMPCHDTPDDRALFSAEFEMPKQETFIANGDLEKDTTTGEIRTMGYRTSYTLPTYLMAFAVGDFVSVAHKHKGVPVKVFARPGLPVDFEGVLKNIIEQMGIFERLLVPYPFEKYALVILPEHESGMEHAGITFQGEIRSTQGQVGHDYSLTAHELAHQWFGNLVTVKTWDDLWVKEGMATLLAEEAQRRFEDENKSQRLFGFNFDVTEGQAIRDPELEPNEKYNDGPYGRSAWLLTQIRAALGEAKFWESLRGVLTKYRMQAIGTDEFLNSFPLSDTLRANAYRALSAKKLPHWEGNDLEDPDGSLIAPLSLSWEGDLFLPDRQDVHPLAHFEGAPTQLIPASLDEVFFKLGAHIPLFALDAVGEWPITPDNFYAFWRQLPSQQARFKGLKLACQHFQEDDRWSSAIEAAMVHPPLLGFPDYDPETQLSECGEALSEKLFARQWREMEENPASPLLNESELILLATFTLSPDRALETWGRVAREGATVRARRIAHIQLRKHYAAIGEFAPPAEGDRPKWTEFFEATLKDVEVSELQEIAKVALAPHKNKLLKNRGSSLEMKPWNQPLPARFVAP